MHVETPFPPNSMAPAVDLATARSRTLVLLGFLAAGFSIGFLAWGRSPHVEQLLWLILLPLAWGFAGDRLRGAALVFGYFLGGARGLPGGATVFFGDLAPLWFGWALWVATSALLAVPFLVLWSNGTFRAYSFATAMCTLILPPFGLIGWVNPVALAGVLFPGAGWGGLALTLWFSAALVKRQPIVILTLAAIAMSCNGVARDIPVPTRWQGVDTHFERLSSAGSDDAEQVLAAMKRVDWVIEFAKSLPKDTVTVLPETILGSFNGLTEYALNDISVALSAKGSRLLVGAEIPLEDGRYRNALVVLGAEAHETKSVAQNIPVPISMWKPWATNGAVASVFGPSNVIQIGDKRAGVAICYEQLLPYSLLSVLSNNTDSLIAVSNVWWARSTSVPNIQSQTAGAFARLFGVGVIYASNI